MPRQRSLLTVIRDLVQQEVRSAIQSLLGSVPSNKPKAKNGRRRLSTACGGQAHDQEVAPFNPSRSPCLGGMLVIRPGGRSTRFPSPASNRLGPVLGTCSP